MRKRAQSFFGTGEKNNASDRKKASQRTLINGILSEETIHQIQFREHHQPEEEINVLDIFQEWEQKKPEKPLYLYLSHQTFKKLYQLDCCRQFKTDENIILNFSKKYDHKVLYQVLFYYDSNDTLTIEPKIMQVVGQLTNRIAEDFITTFGTRYYSTCDIFAERKEHPELLLHPPVNFNQQL